MERNGSPAFNLAPRTPARFDGEGNAIAGPSGSRNRRPLFDKSTPAPPNENDNDEEDEYGDSFVDFGEEDFSAIDLLSQAASAKQKSVGVVETPRRKKGVEMLVLDSEDGPTEQREVLILEEDDDFTFGSRGGATADPTIEEEEEEEAEEQYDDSQGPTKKSKKEWNLFGN